MQSHFKINEQVVVLSHELRPHKMEFPICGGHCTTVYAIYVTYRYFRDFGLGWGIRKGLISRFCDVFIAINSHILKRNF